MTGLPERNVEMQRLYEEEGLTLQDLADSYGLHQGSVWRIAHRMGWKMRKAAPLKGLGRYWDL